jgi:hypothetical protein
MKKLGLILSLLALLPISVFATSGACSGHGGVSCGSGKDSDGSVICNDGWRNSSVLYSSMVMCQGYSATPTVKPPAPKSISTPPKPVVVTPTPSAPKPVVIEPVKPITPPAINRVVTPKVEKPVPVPTKEVVKETIQNKPPITKVQVVQDTPKPKGFWARFFSFF